MELSGFPAGLKDRDDNASGSQHSVFFFPPSSHLALSCVRLAALCLCSSGVLCRGLKSDVMQQESPSSCNQKKMCAFACFLQPTHTVHRACVCGGRPSRDSSHACSNCFQLFSGAAGEKKGKPVDLLQAFSVPVGVRRCRLLKWD